MTGTGKLGEKEFFDLYSKLVVEIQPIIRLFVMIKKIEYMRNQMKRIKRYLRK